MKKRIILVMAIVTMAMTIIAVPQVAHAEGPWDIATATVEVNAQPYRDGMPVEPKPTDIYISGNVTTDYKTIYLREGIDYTLSYANNIEIGKRAEMTLTGIGNCTGKKTVFFTIREMRPNLADAQVSSIPAQAYTGNPVTPKPSVFLSSFDNHGHGDVTLYEGEDYTISYAHNVEIGTAQLTITAVPKPYTGGREFVGSQTVQFRIVEKRVNLANCNVESIPNQDYTGFPVEPKLTVNAGYAHDYKALYEGEDYTVSYAHNTDPGTATATITGTGTDYIGTQTVEFKIVPVNVYRVYNRYTGEHIFTIDKAEYDNLRRTSGWVDEHTAWTAPKSSAKPVYRLYNKWSGEHHYTWDVNEYNKLGSDGWNKEGIKFYSDPQETIPVYRAFNPYVNGAPGSHHYTTDLNEYNSLANGGWRKEDVCWYGAPES